MFLSERIQAEPSIRGGFAAYVATLGDYGTALTVAETLDLIATLQACLPGEPAEPTESGSPAPQSLPHVDDLPLGYVLRVIARHAGSDL